MTRLNTKDPQVFWRNYEAQLGEQVFAYALGRYIRGWEGFNTPLWGLLIATSGGFRFHHFPHESWIDALSRTTMGGEPPQERLIFIAQERLIALDLQEERLWWKKLLNPQPPLLVIRYQDDAGQAQELIAETEKKAAAILLALDPRRRNP
ncbi:MAG: hypothetical protein LBD93_05375 [Treponema sp.]|jgi:hypothetical protein|nr:hypothetical protein [Treponema sp.]